MFDIFSPRELAIGVWFIILVVLMMVKKDFCLLLLQLVKAACAWKLLLSFFFLVIYAICVVTIFSLTLYWSNLFLKKIISWFVFAGVPLVFDAKTNLEKNTLFFRKTLSDNIKFMVIVSFIVNFIPLAFGVNFFLFHLL